jgi:hypothetical protein
MTFCGQRHFSPPSLEIVLEDHLIQRILCDDLEAVADRLPALPTLPAIRRLCDRLQCITTSHFVRAERMLASLPTPQRPGHAAMTALHRMHLIDEIHAQDLIATLWQHARLGKGQNADQLGYMLRCFFDGCRRAIALKESMIAGAGLMPISLD